jgi:hypothetical protein
VVDDDQHLQVVFLLLNLVEEVQLRPDQQGNDDDAMGVVLMTMIHHLMLDLHLMRRHELYVICYLTMVVHLRLMVVPWFHQEQFHHQDHWTVDLYPTLLETHSSTHEMKQNNGDEHKALVACGHY